MPTVLAHRLLLGASLGLGVVDVAWLDLSLAPRVLASTDERAPVVAEASPPADDQPSANSAPPDEAIETSPPANEVPPATPEPRALADVSIDKQVYFASMKAELDGTAREVLDSLVHNAPTGATFLLDGHADYRGEDAYNKKLSARRAKAVVAYLAERGIERDRIRIGSIGEEEPHAADELWRDRRVDIQISGGPR
jgi:OOP family OmpA-OmpF porin